MGSQTFRPQDSPSPDEIEVRELYRQMLDGWNKRSAGAFAAPIAEDGDLIGFDGSQLVGRAEIVSTLQQIFADHLTAPYVSKVRGVRFLRPDVAVLRADRWSYYSLRHLHRTFSHKIALSTDMDTGDVLPFLFNRHLDEARTANFKPLFTKPPFWMPRASALGRKERASLDVLFNR